MFRGEITARYERKTSLVFKANRVVNKSCSATSFVMQSVTPKGLDKGLVKGCVCFFF